MTATQVRPGFVSDTRSGNPFARPGAIPPLDGRGRPLDLTTLATRLRRLGAAAIEGPHGHGKTTLLVALAETCGAAGVPVNVVRVRSWRDALAVGAALRGLPPGGLACVDGWESLGPVRGPLRLAARLLGRRLLVTSHGPEALPVLRRCRTTPALLRAVVARLPARAGRIADEEVDEAFRRHAGNVRDALFDLYDRFERRGRQPA